MTVNNQSSSQLRVFSGNLLESDPSLPVRPLESGEESTDRNLAANSGPAPIAKTQPAGQPSSDPKKSLTSEGVASYPLAAEICRSFSLATGWNLRYIPQPQPNQELDALWTAPVDPGIGDAPGHLRLDLGGLTSSDTTPPCDLDHAVDLASALAELLATNLRARHELQCREAELATAVPVVEHFDDRRPTANRLEAVLKSGVRLLGGRAMALYVLDETSTRLKLRVGSGIPWERLMLPPRSLKDSPADLEALAGRAVVLESPFEVSQVCVPEPCNAAICVPVSTPSTPLGTLWFFSNHERAFSDAEVESVEVMAGRIACEMERGSLLAAAVEGTRLKRQVANARRWQRNQFPQVNPHLAQWEISGWTLPGNLLGSEFYDWFVRDDGRLAFGLGGCPATGVEGALAASGLRGAWRAMEQYSPGVDELLSRLNRNLWTASCGDQIGSLFLGRLDVDSGLIRYSLAGTAGMLLMRKDGFESIAPPQPQLGLEPQCRYALNERQIERGDLVIVAGNGVWAGLDGASRTGAIRLLADLIEPMRTLPASTIARSLREQWRDRPVKQQDRSLLIMRRTWGR